MYYALYDAGQALLGMDGTVLSPANHVTDVLNSRQDLEGMHPLEKIIGVCTSNSAWAQLIDEHGEWVGSVSPSGQVNWHP